MPAWSRPVGDSITMPIDWIAERKSLIAEHIEPVGPDAIRAIDRPRFCRGPATSQVGNRCGAVRQASPQPRAGRIAKVREETIGRASNGSPGRGSNTTPDSLRRWLAKVGRKAGALHPDARELHAANA